MQERRAAAETSACLESSARLITCLNSPTDIAPHAIVPKVTGNKAQLKETTNYLAGNGDVPEDYELKYIRQQF